MNRAPLLSFLVLLGGCAPFELGHLAPLEDALLGVDDTHSVARVVRVDSDPVQTTEIALAEGHATLVPRPGSGDTEIAIFTEGTLGSEDELPIPAEVVLVDRTGELSRWTLPRQFRVAQMSEDGRYLYATAPWGRLVVENEVSVVDLTEPAGPMNPRSLSLRSLGGEVPSAAAFSEPMPWPDGAPLRLAALFAAGQLSLFDLDRPDAPPLTIPTTVNTAAVGPEPVEARFVDQELVVRTAAGSQLLVVSLTQSLDGARRFDVALRTLAASGRVSAIAVDRRSTTPRLIALTGTRVHIYDLETSLESSVELPSPYSSILAFEGPAPGDPTTRPRLVLWGTSPSLTFLELGDEPSAVMDASALPLAFTPSHVVADGAAGRLLAFVGGGHGGGFDVAGSAGRTPASVIDLYDRSALALATTPDVSRAAVSSDLSDVWIASGDGYVNRFDIDTRSQEELWLDDPVQSLLPLPGSAQRVLAFHELPAGSFTILAPGDTAPRHVGGVF